MAHRPSNGSEEPRAADIGAFGRAYADALIRGDEIAAEVTVREAIDAGLGVARIDDEIITPALWLVGALWERGDLSVAEEHLATEITLRILALQREAHRVSRDRARHRIVLAAPQGELHVVALHMAANLLQEAGYDVVMLGADVPTDALVAFVSRRKPGAVCLTATMPTRFEQLLELVGAVQASWPAVSFVVGGQGFEGRVAPSSGIEVCERVPAVVEAVDAAVQHARLN